MQGHTTQGELGGIDFMAKIVDNYGFIVVHEVEHHSIQSLSQRGLKIVRFSKYVDQLVQNLNAFRSTHLILG